MAVLHGLCRCVSQALSLVISNAMNSVTASTPLFAFAARMLKPDFWATTKNGIEIPGIYFGY